MSNVLSLQLARERAWRLRGGSNGHAFKKLALPLWNSEITGLDGRRLRGRLQAENAQLRRRVVELVLQIQALRDGAGTLSAYDAARHRRDVP
jgi:cell division protein FtsB